MKAKIAAVIIFLFSAMVLELGIFDPGDGPSPHPGGCHRGCLRIRDRSGRGLSEAAFELLVGDGIRAREPILVFANRILLFSCVKFLDHI